MIFRLLCILLCACALLHGQLRAEDEGSPSASAQPSLSAKAAESTTSEAGSKPLMPPFPTHKTNKSSAAIQPPLDPPRPQDAAASPGALSPLPPPLLQHAEPSEIASEKPVPEAADQAAPDRSGEQTKGAPEATSTSKQAPLGADSESRADARPEAAATQPNATARERKAAAPRSQGEAGKKRPVREKKNAQPSKQTPLLSAGITEESSQNTPLPPFFSEARTKVEAAERIEPPMLPGLPRSEEGEKKAEQEPEPQITIESMLTKKVAAEEGEETDPSQETLDMLNSLVELQKTIKQEISATGKRLKISVSENEKASLQAEMSRLDKQFAETMADFERIATGVDSSIFIAEKAQSFSWRQEVAILLEPTVKELKQFTARARQKTQLKETINAYNKQAATATQALEHLNGLIDQSKNAKINRYLQDLLPAWRNMEKRIRNKRDLAQMELNKLEANDVSLFESSGAWLREFFRTRGFYLGLALFSFVFVLVGLRLLCALLFHFLPGAKKEQRPFHVRIIDIFFQVFSIVAAVFSLFLVLYLTEDWFLLSMVIVVFFGMIWTARQAWPKLWKQALLMLNMGAVREGERIMYGGVPWRVEAINVFCKLANPALGHQLRIPIEYLLGQISRPYTMDEPWFPCKKGDWVMIEGKLFAKVSSLSHEQVELVEVGGRRTLYQTSKFIGLAPSNLSRNFSLRVVLGLSYSLQAEISGRVLSVLKDFIRAKLDENDYSSNCLSLNVDFFQAGASSLDVAVFADFKGELAGSYRRIERALQRWCVECCTEQGWEIPFPQLSLHSNLAPPNSSVVQEARHVR